MKTGSFLTLLITWSFTVSGQVINPDLLKINDPKSWIIFNRGITLSCTENNPLITFDTRQGEGIAVFQNLEFKNGTIEFDVKGKNILQQSFVGVAFHIIDEMTYDAVYFRPFNFRNEDPVRRNHSVQYISHPEFTWQKLRSEYPEQYENPVNPVPDPDQFFHAKVVIDYPLASIYIENSEQPCLEVKLLGKNRSGKIGFWVGNGSDGTFRNIMVSK